MKNAQGYDTSMKKLIEDAIAINVQMRDRCGDELVRLFKERPAQTARDFLTISIETGMRTGKTTTVGLSARSGDLILVRHTQLIRDVVDCITETQGITQGAFELMNVGIVSYDWANVGENELQRLNKDLSRYDRIICDDITGAEMMAVYAATARSANQTWVRLGCL